MDTSHDKTTSDFLGTCMLDGTTIDRAIQAGVTAAHFVSSLHREQWRLLVQLRLAGKPTDVEGAYAAAAADPATLAGIGGAAALVLHQQNTSLHGGALIAAIVSGYAHREAGRLLSLGSRALAAGELDLDGVRGIAEQVVETCNGIRPSSARTLKDIADSIRHDIAETEAGRSQEGELSWGLPKLDRFMYPIRRYDYMLVCGRPGAGKTSMLAHLALTTLRKGGKVVVFNLEDEDTRFLEKMVIQSSGVQGISSGAVWMGLTKADRDKFHSAMDKIVATGRLLIFDKDKTLGQIQSRCGMLAQTFKQNLTILDYLGLVVAPGRDIYERVSTVSKAMIPLRKTLNSALVVGQQLKRLEGGNDTEPGLKDLRDSGQLEEDASRVVMLHNKDARYLDLDHRPYRILQPKMRGGPACAVDGINFHAPTTVFSEASHGN
jgi:replicative DNA helicase